MNGNVIGYKVGRYMSFEVINITEKVNYIDTGVYPDNGYCLQSNYTSTASIEAENISVHFMN
jgi:hypothetical protein